MCRGHENKSANNAGDAKLMRVYTLVKASPLRKKRFGTKHLLGPEAHPINTVQVSQ